MPSEMDSPMTTAVAVQGPIFLSGWGRGGIVGMLEVGRAGGNPSVGGDVRGTVELSTPNLRSAFSSRRVNRHWPPQH
jgi:hypothetical protein